MPRRKPQSAKQHKAQLQLKRAVKRGNIQPETSITSSRHGATVTEGGPSSRRLQSSFVKLSREFLDDAKRRALSVPLPRPIPAEIAVYPENFDVASNTLNVPRRPKWNYDMEKKQVEKNEEAVFAKWRCETDKVIAGWLDSKKTTVNPEDQGQTELANDFVLHPSPTHYEQNLEVWRQLWRVAEISQILMILLDSRCPPLHFPQSLHSYVTSLRPPRRIILVLTKVDISGVARSAAWSKYLLANYPDVRVVQVESYVEREIGAGQGKRKLFDPHIPSAFKLTLVEALKAAHEDLCTPPVHARENEERSKGWRPTVRPVVDWEAVLTAGGDAGKEIGGALAPQLEATPVVDEDSVDFLTVGVIGQPNVGKSSLLNALFGTRRVKASRTPGKTKHFQTLFWTSHVRLVDCPGLVFPNFIPIEMQVLAGVLPIAQVASIPSCVHHALIYLPLERIFGLVHPNAKVEETEDKRTWRQGTRVAKKTEIYWTAMDVMTAFATLKGWVTAKAGRPDVNRAGNHILRILAEGRIKWAFWPPGTQIAQEDESEGAGIWIQSNEETLDYDGSGEDADGSDHTPAVEENPNESDDTGSIHEPVRNLGMLNEGRFGALALDDSDESDDQSTQMDDEENHQSDERR
ncbi:P-loop containing nucleoside triphosphate hydrolase protein [Rickenella mellea]|uniref:Guanine nucleotide-binding protein-like 1 n=1 Tax=Rickenella mellea TaxID=50990 RepID=A0A4Y7QKE6_9AGAM|nr:P-loop containing nucleoside triphosphate hydrolase protein [Rickenella mellea]